MHAPPFRSLHGLVPHTRIPLVVLQALVLVLPGWNHRMLPPCPMSRCPRWILYHLHRLTQASSVSKPWETYDPGIKTYDKHWKRPLTSGRFGSQLGQHQGKVSGAAHIMTLSVLPSWKWMMTPRIQDTRTTESVMLQEPGSFTYKTTARLFGTQSMTFQNWV